MWFHTRSVVLTAGFGVGGTRLNAFDSALRSAGIADFNLVKVTSIVPPALPVHQLPYGRQLIRGDGLLVPTVYEVIESDQEDVEIAVAVGAAVPHDTRRAGVIFVTSCHGSAKEAEAAVVSMVAEGMEAKGGIPHRCEVASAAGFVRAPWSAAVAAAFFCDPQLEELFGMEPDD